MNIAATGCGLLQAGEDEAPVCSPNPPARAASVGTTIKRDERRHSTAEDQCEEHENGGESRRASMRVGLHILSFLERHVNPTGPAAKPDAGPVGGSSRVLCLLLRARKNAVFAS